MMRGLRVVGLCRDFSAEAVCMADEKLSCMTVIVDVVDHDGVCVNLPVTAPLLKADHSAPLTSRAGLKTLSINQKTSQMPEFVDNAGTTGQEFSLQVGRLIFLAVFISS